MRSKESRRRRKEEGKKERERDMKLHVAGRTFRSTCTLSTLAPHPLTPLPSPSPPPPPRVITRSYLHTRVRPAAIIVRRDLYFTFDHPHTNIRARTLALVNRTCVPCAAVKSGGKNVEEKERIKEMMKNGEKKKYRRGLSSRSRCYPPKIPF